MDGVTASAIIFALSLLLTSLANYVVWRATRIGALKIWAVSGLVGLAGLCALVIAVSTRSTWLVSLQNLLFYTSLSLVPAGLYHCRGKKFPLRAHLMAIVLAVTTLLAVKLLFDSFVLHTLINSGVYATYCFHIVYLIQQQTREKNVLRHFAVGAWGAYGLVNLTRMALAIFGIGIDDGQLFQGITYVLVFLLGPICTTGGYFGLILLIVQRLLDERQSALTVAERLATQYRELSHHDPLTNTFNRRKFMRQLAAALRNCRETNTTMSVIMADLDHFKRINDIYGHAAGDATLKRSVQIWQGLLRVPDILGRVGGEEFAIILPGADVAEALQIAERLREGLAAAPMEIPESITASFGAAEIASHNETPEQILRRADDAMYNAKRLGRNRVMVSATA